MKPGLYIVATPIGNLGDISTRAQKTLGAVDIIICENLKHSIKLLAKLGIKKKVYQLHDHNENKIIKKIEKISFSHSFALISDAGSPLVSDPGYKLVQYFINNKLFITSIPGPTSVISALQVSGLPSNSFKYLGFVPKTKNEIENFVENLNYEYQTTIFFVSSHKLMVLLDSLDKKLKLRNISVCKELTKLNEKVFRGAPKDVIKKIKNDKKNSLGEFVIVLEGLEKNSVSIDIGSSSLNKQIHILLKKFSLTDVVAIVHKLTNISKKIVYKKVLEQKK